jgi:uncharacterized protein RhaS with RHS repeats
VRTSLRHINRKPDGQYGSQTIDSNKLIRLTGSTGWRFSDSGARQLESYDSAGAMRTIHRAEGGSSTYAYSTGVVAGISPRAGLLISVTDQFGRPVRFHYEQPPGLSDARIYRVIGPDDRETLVGYDAAGNVASLAWPDTKTRKFVYERADLPWR